MKYKRINKQANNQIDNKMIEDVVRKAIKETDKKNINSIAEAVADKLEERYIEIQKDKLEKQKWYNNTSISTFVPLVMIVVSIYFLPNLVSTLNKNLEEKQFIFSVLFGFSLGLMSSMVIWFLQERMRNRELKESTKPRNKRF